MEQERASITKASRRFWKTANYLGDGLLGREVRS
jgi:hypothetical protein